MSYEKPIRYVPEKNRRMIGYASRPSILPLPEVKIPYTALLFKEGNNYSGAASILYDGNQSKVLHWRAILFDRSRPRKIIIPVDLLTGNNSVLGMIQTETYDADGNACLKNQEFNGETQKKLDFIVRNLAKSILSSELEEKTMNPHFKGYVRKFFNEEYLARINSNGKKFHRILDHLALPSNTNFC